MGKIHEEGKSKPDKMLADLFRKNRIYLITIIMLAILFAVSFGAGVFLCYREEVKTYFREHYDPEIPYKEEVVKIMRGLRYTNIPVLEREGVNIDLFFKEKKWGMSGMYKFDDNRNIILAAGNAGACRAFTYYVYNKIKDIFDDDYKLNIVLAQEAKYFPAPGGTHFIIGIDDKSTLFEKQYVIDPSYKRYGKLEDFEEYFFLGPIEYNDFQKGMNREARMSLGNSIPLIMKGQFLVELLIDSMGNEYNPDNYAMVITARRKYTYSGRLILSIRKYQGKISFLENKEAFKGIISGKEYDRIKKLAQKLFLSIEYKE